MRVLVTGNLGFIGAHFVGWLLANELTVNVIGFARNSNQRNAARGPRLFAHYAGLEWDGPAGLVIGRTEALEKVRDMHARFHQIFGDLTDARAMSGICEQVDVVVHFAAKTFVDHSLKDPAPFLQSNIIGTHALLNEAERYKVPCYVQVSTDEVYGQILEGRYREDAPLNPRNPYAWSKAAADLDVVWRTATRGFPGIITRTENNFGPFQDRQKALPTFVRTALADEPLPVYGDGGHVRCWLYVEDHCRAIWHLASRWWKLGATPFGIYHVAGEQELTNLELARFVLRTLGKPEDRIRFIPDQNARPGHDRRYALEVEKLKTTGWAPRYELFERLAYTVRWYAENAWWTA